MAAIWSFQDYWCKAWTVCDSCERHPSCSWRSN